MKYQKRLLFLFKLLRVISLLMIIFFVVSFLIHAFFAIVSTIGSLEKLYEFALTYYPILEGLTIEPAIYYICEALFDVSGLIITILYFSYFKKVIDERTPFVDRLAKILFKVSIINIILPIATTGAALTMYRFNGLELTKAMSDVSDSILGVIGLLFYLIVKAAIEINNNEKRA